jgi:hypothetical protein
VRLNTTAPYRGLVAHHSVSQGTRDAVPLLYLGEPCRTHLHDVPSDHPEGGDSSSRPSIHAENHMVEKNEHLALDAGTTGTCQCVDAEHFSGYIITTSSGTR